MKVFFLLFPFLVFSQQQVAKGEVLDKVTNEPIPYVNISILESTVGTSSDDAGSYTLNIKEEDVDKNVHLSSLGYKDTTLILTSFTKLKTIFLNPLAEELDEVVITEKLEEEYLEINPIKKRDVISGFGGFKDHPYIFALYLPFKEEYSDLFFIDKVKVFLNKVNVLGGRKSMSSKFRFRMFSVGKDSLPDKDLISENIIVTTTKKQRDVEIDLSEFSIIFPKEGVFVAIEWLHIPFNEYKFTYTKGKVIKKKVTEIRYAPRLSWIKQKDQNNKLAVFALGQWLNFKMPYSKKGKYMIPAISLTLSN